MVNKECLGSGNLFYEKPIAPVLAFIEDMAMLPSISLNAFYSGHF